MKNSTLLKQISFQSEFKKQGLRIFTSREFGQLFRLSKTQAKYYLETYTMVGLFLRLKRGLYCLKDNKPNEEEIANALYKPSYVSFEYALAYHNIMPEMVYSVTSATTKPTRLFVVEGKSFSYRTIKRKVFVGYTPLKHNEHTVLIAEPEKALVDYLYFAILDKKDINDRLATKKINKKRAVEYAERYHNKRLSELVSKIL